MYNSSSSSAYGSGTSLDSESSWPTDYSSWFGSGLSLAADVAHEMAQTTREMAGNTHKMAATAPVTRSQSYGDAYFSTSSQREVMLDFKMNGFDSPYEPEDGHWGRFPGRPLAGLGPASAYLRQKSWPEPSSSPAMPLPRRPEGLRLQTPQLSPPSPVAAMAAAWTDEGPSQGVDDVVTAEQLQLLQSLTEPILRRLLKEMQPEARLPTRLRPRKTSDDCRFCKNNGERESYYRSHVLKDAWGRVTCPVLRAFVCKRCGASGDRAHTIKYCPLSTDEERIQSAAMMRSVRMASGRRRVSASAPSAAVQPNDLLFGEAPFFSEKEYSYELDPVWAALEQKLLQKC